MKLFSTVFPKDDAVAVLEGLSTNCTIQIQKAPSSSTNELPFLEESSMLQELLTNLTEIQNELSSANCALDLPFITEDQARSLKEHVKGIISSTSMTKFLQEKKAEVGRIKDKIKNDSGVVHSLTRKIRTQFEFVSLMQSIYREFHQDDILFSGSRDFSELRSSIRGIFLFVFLKFSSWCAMSRILGSNAYKIFKKR
jgi:hypothetical protein